MAIHRDHCFHHAYTLEPSSWPCLICPQAILAGDAFDRRTTGNRFLVQIAAQGLQAGRVGKVDQGDLQLNRLGTPGKIAVTIPSVPHHENSCATYRRLDCRAQRQALGVDQHAFGIELQLAVSV